jgi:hypothetical protein
MNTRGEKQCIMISGLPKNGLPLNRPKFGLFREKILSYVWAQ